MTATTQPKIAHGIARLHPEAVLGSQWRWGPDWSLPMRRSGRWAIDTIYNAAIRVEFGDGAPGAPGEALAYAAVRDELVRAREALSEEDERRLAEWLGYADRREGEAFVRKFTARRRREYGDVPKVRRGELIRPRYGTGLWHIATGDCREGWSANGARNPDVLHFPSFCMQLDVCADLGADEPGDAFQRTADPDVPVCKRCRARATEAESRTAGEPVAVGAAAS